LTRSALVATASFRPRRRHATSAVAICRTQATSKAIASAIRTGRVARDQFAASLYLKPAGVLPGDLLFFAMKNPGAERPDHVGIYVGKGFFVHASVTNGVHIDSISNPYYYQRIVSVRKYRGF